MITVIIDGYNFIFNSYPKINIKAEKLQELRNKTINLLSQYYNVKKNKVVVVFDGYKTDEPSEARYTIDNIEIVYSKRGEKADEVIMRMVSIAENALVVTNDNEIKRYAEKIYNVSCISPEEFKLLIYGIIEESRISAGNTDNARNEGYEELDEKGDRKNSGKKRGNPHRLSKKERLKLQKIRKL